MRSGGASPRSLPPSRNSTRSASARASAGSLLQTMAVRRRLADHVVAQEHAQVAGAARVEAQRRLIEQHHLRIAQQAAREREPLPHAARVLAVAAVGGLRQPDPIEQRRRPPARLARASGRAAPRSSAGCRAPTRDSESCARHRPRTPPGAETPPRRPRRRGRATLACPDDGQQQTAQDAHQRRLARAVRAHDADDLAGGDRKRNVRRARRAASPKNRPRSIWPRLAGGWNVLPSPSATMAGAALIAAAPSLRRPCRRAGTSRPPRCARRRCARTGACRRSWRRSTGTGCRSGASTASSAARPGLEIGPGGSPSCVYVLYGLSRSSRWMRRMRPSHFWQAADRWHGDRAAIDDGRVGLQQLGRERRHAQSVDEHLRDARPLLGAAGLLLDDRREHDDVVVVEPERLLQLERGLGVRGPQLAPHLAVAAHQRDQRARRRAARPQAVGVGEQVAFQRVPGEPQLGGERRVAGLRGELGLAGDPARPRGSRRPRSGSCPGARRPSRARRRRPSPACRGSVWAMRARRSRSARP